MITMNITRNLFALAALALSACGVAQASEGLTASELVYESQTVECATLNKGVPTLELVWKGLDPAKVRSVLVLSCNEDAESKRTLCEVEGSLSVETDLLLIKTTCTTMHVTVMREP